MQGLALQMRPASQPKHVRDWLIRAAGTAPFVPGRPLGALSYGGGPPATLGFWNKKEIRRSLSWTLSVVLRRAQ